MDPEGNRTQVDKFNLYPKDSFWTSTRTFNDYPTEWVLEAPQIDLYIEAVCAFPNQEFATAISKPAFWEGRMEIKGSLRNEAIEGPGFVERSGFINAETMEEFFKVVSRETLKSVQYILPKNPNNEKLAELVSTKKTNKIYTRN
ncbi:MAG: lipocalin family protein [Chitinophagales bacterium]|nr:lipocalin family protein [Chitinophagales bacterium]